MIVEWTVLIAACFGLVCELTLFLGKDLLSV